MNQSPQLPLIYIKRPCSLNGRVQKPNEIDESKLTQLNNYDFAIEYYTNGINNDKTNTLFLIKRAICYLAKGFYMLALKDALRTIEIDPSFQKGYYIASLSYLEMYDIEKSQRYANSKNQRLNFLIEKRKNEINSKLVRFPLYAKYLFFLKELYKYNAYFPKVDIHFYTNDNRGVIAKTSIQKEEIVMAIPKECLISLEVAFNSDLGKEIGKFMYSELNSPKHCLLSAYLLSEAKNEKWKFYFDLLPKDFSNFPIFYTEEELEILKGSPFLTQLYEKKIEMKMDYEKICFYIPSFAKYTFLQFCQARMLISSRIFGISINNVKTDVLAPFADLLNHSKQRQTQWYFDNSLDSFVIQAKENITEGSEIFDSYGQKTNARFLLHYGFALENNESGEYLITFMLNQSYPLYEDKKNFFNSEFDYRKHFQLNSNIYESALVELLSFLRFLLFDGDINYLYKVININKNLLFEEVTGNFFYVSPMTKELEIKVLKHFLIVLKECLRKYPTTIEEDKMVIKSKKGISFNMRNCINLLISEKNVINYYIYFCEYCLSLFKMTENEINIKIKRDIKFIEYQFDFYVQGVILKLIKV